MSLDEVWALCRFDLRLSESETWQLTMRELSFLMKRFSESEKRKDIRNAKVCFSIFRANGNKKVKFEDFLPSEKKEQTAEDMLRIAKAITVRLGGEIIE